MPSNVVKDQRHHSFSVYDTCDNLLKRLDGRKLAMRSKYALNNELNVKEILDNWPETLSVFLKHGLLCVGCSVAPFHTITEACIEHKLDEAVIRSALFNAVRSASSSSTTE